VYKRQVLGAIIGASEMAQLPGLSDERRKSYFTMTLGACDRARQLIRQILTFARATPSVHRSVELAPVIAEALSLLRASLPATIELRQQLEANAVVLGDSTRVHQVIMNLGANAGLAMPDGGVLAVTLSTIDVDAIFAAPHPGLRCGPAARITVSDTGVGMSPAVRARIFEPFFTTRTQGQGTGLGLAVVHGIINDSAGAITVESAHGHGTTFTIILPLCDKPAHDSTAERIAIRGHRERILFVDDEPVLCNLAAEALGNLNYVVTTVSDGQSALDLLKRDPLAFDLLITDSTMPRMTGPALIAAARIVNPNLRIILSSGQSMSNAERYFLAKPMTMSELGNMVRTALDHPPGA
jgi:CheY-like chemotaxis protein